MDILLRRSGYMACEPRHSFGPMAHEFCFISSFPVVDFLSRKESAMFCIPGRDS